LIALFQFDTLHRSCIVTLVCVSVESVLIQYINCWESRFWKCCRLYGWFDYFNISKHQSKLHFF